MTHEAVKKSRILFDSGFYCAESILKAVSEHQGIASDLIPKIATGFCGGVSRTCGMCGAVSGSVMALNLVSGRNYPETSVKENYLLVQQFIAQFKKKFGTVNCKELIGYDLNDPSEYQLFIDNNCIEKCKDFTEEATRMVLILIEQALL